MVPVSVLQWKGLAQLNADVHPPLTVNEILSVVWSESTGNPNAINPSDPSYGLMQLTMPIAKAFSGVPITDPKQLLEPTLNMGIGCAFLAHLKETYSEHFPTTWIAGYNEGEGNLTRGVADQPYVAAFDSHMEELENESVT